MLEELAARAEALAVPLGLAAIGAVWAYDAYIRWRLPAHETGTAHGTAHFADRVELTRAGLLGADGLYVGRWQNKPLRAMTDRHLCTLAPTRSGKGVAAIIPNLLTYPGSAIVIDPKGEAAAITARRRREMGQAVYIVDPFGITGAQSARFNPLANLTGESPDLVEDAAILAQALVPESQGDDNHWLNEGRALLAGLILHVATTEPTAMRHLGQVRKLLTQPPAPFAAMLATMAESQAASGLVARAAARIMQKSEREKSSVLSTAQAQTHILDSPRLAQNMAASDFNFGDLKAQGATVYIVLPADKLVAFGRWLRLVVSQAIVELVRKSGRPKRPVLFILDEFAALGYLEPVETAMGLLAGYGVQLWPILQDLSQLRDLYPHRWPTFLGNAGVVQAFGCAETTTAEWLSSRLGNRTVATRQQSMSGAAVGGVGMDHYSQSVGVVSRPLLTPDELMRLPAESEILLMPGHAPALVGKLAYFRDKEYAGLFDANPWRAEAF
jgi:type IV secretion system protein VirD4